MIASWKKFFVLVINFCVFTVVVFSNGNTDLASSNTGSKGKISIVAIDYRDNENLIKAFNLKYPDIELDIIELTGSPTEQYDKLTIMLTAGQKIDGAVMWSDDAYDRFVSLGFWSL